MEGIYSGVKYLERNRKLGEHKESSLRIWKGVSTGYGKYKMAKKRKRNI